jgi:RHS repeat-associated protein
VDPRILVRRPKTRRLTLTFLATAGLGTLLAAVTPAFGAITATPERNPVAGATELPDLRTEHSRTYQRPNGVRVAEISQDPLNYQDAGGRWAPIQLGLVPDATPGFAFRTKANSAVASLPNRLNGAPVRVTRGQDFVSFSLEGARASAPEQTADGVIYRDALPGVSVTYAALASGLKEDLVLAGPTAQRRFTYHVKISHGLSARENPDGSVVFLDADGKPRLSFAPPSMADASKTPEGSSSAVDVDLAAVPGGYDLTYTADQKWLEAPARQFPVRVDPTVLYNAYYTSQGLLDFDCYLDTAAPSSQCAGTGNWVGSDAVAPPATRHKYRTLAAFGLSTSGTYGQVIPGSADVLDAWLLMHPAYNQTPKPLGAYALTQNWNSGSATWADAMTGAPWMTGTLNTPGGAFVDDAKAPVSSLVPSGTWAGWYQWSPTAIVQGWVRKATTNLGFLIKQTDEGAPGLTAFDSKASGTPGNAPILWVSYRPAPIGAGPTDTIDAQQLTDRMALGVNLATGNLLVQANDLSMPGIGVGLNVGRTYNSLAMQADVSLNLGPRWVMDAAGDINLTVFADGNATFFGPGGFGATFTKLPSGGYTPPPGFRATLVSDAAGTGSVTIDGTGEVYKFSGGTLTEHADRNGQKIAYAVPAPLTQTITDTQSRVTTLAYSGGTGGHVDSMSSVGSRTWGYGYDPTTKNLETYTDPENKQTVFTYDDAPGASNDLISIKDPELNVTKIDYSSAASGRRVTKVTRVTALTTDTDPSWSYAYPAMTSACSVFTGAVSQTEVTDGKLHTSTFCFDAQGRLLAGKDGVGQVSKNGYDVDSGGLKTLENPLGGPSVFTDFTWTAASGGFNLTQGTEPAQAIWKQGFTNASFPHFPTTMTPPQGNVRATKHDANGNPCAISVFVAAPLCTSTQSLQLQNELTLGSPLLGTLKLSKDANGNQTSYTYTGTNRTGIDLPAPLGDESYGYDALGRVMSATDGKSNQTTYTYDKLDRLKSVSDPVGLISYTYDDAGNLTLRQVGSAQRSFGYDDLNRVISQSGPSNPGDAVSYTYDLAGNLERVTSGADTVAYEYDAADRLVLLRDDPDGADRRTTFGYPAANQTTTLYPGGVVKMTSTYNSSGRISSIEAKTTSTPSTLLSSFSYTYIDAAAPTDLVNTMQDLVAGTTTTYGYNPQRRLASAKVTITANPLTVLHTYSYTYDDNGNRKIETVDGIATMAGTPNAANQSLTIGTTGLAFDANGNQTTYGTGTFVYNARNQATQLTSPAGATTAVTYGDAGEAERTKLGASFLRSDIRGIVGRGGSAGGTGGGSAATYVRDPGGTLVADRVGATTLYYLFDGLGSVVGLTDASGTVVQRYGYDPYGRIITTTPEATDNPFRFTGGYFESTSGLYAMGQRYYEPKIGRWTQQDAIVNVVNPQMSNRYNYASDDPVNLVDPYGTSVVSAIWGAYHRCQRDALVAGTAGALAGIAAGAATAGPTAGLSVPTAVIGGSVGGAVGGCSASLIKGALDFIGYY